MAKSKKVYIVLSRDYEYNDEVYECHEGGNTVVGFEKLEMAEDKRNKLTVEFVRKTPEIIFDCYDLRDVIGVHQYNIKKVVETCEFPIDAETFYKYITDYDYEVLIEFLTKKISEESLIKFINNYIKKDRLPYFVQEVAIEKEW